ncbi:MAG: HEAT repeat domain-containing protein, partial [Thermoplasmata archaeon]
MAPRAPRRSRSRATPGRSRSRPPDTPSRRAATIRRSIRRGRLDDLTPLLVALSDPSPGVRQTAAIALGILRDPRARSTLAAALTDPDAGVRAGAAEALGSIGRLESREPLERALEDADAHVRARAAGALRALADPRSIPALAARAGDDATEV